MAGNFLCVVGKHAVHKTREVLLLELSMTNGVLDDPPRILDIVLPPAHFGHVVVSQHGRLLFQDDNCAWLYENCGDTQKKELNVNMTAHLSKPNFLREDIRRIWFSENGLLAIVESSAPNNLHRIRMWSVNDITKGTFYQYLHGNPTSTHPIHSIIPFPSSLRCILWDEHSNICVLAPTTQKSGRPLCKIEGLQALVVTPDEKHVILVVVHRRRSKILSSTLLEEKGHIILARPFRERGTLGHLIATPKRCAIAVDALNCEEGWFNLYLLHSDGKLDQIRVNCNS